MYRRTMLFASIILVCISAMAAAQSVPTSISYQGKLTNNGVPVPDGTHQVQFKLYTVASGGTAFWTSNVQDVDTIRGIFTTQIAPLSASDLSGKTDVYLEVLAGNPFGPLTPRVKFQSVPFALQASSLQLTTGAAAGKVLTSDASGNGVWQLVAPGSIDTTGASSGKALVFDGMNVVWGYSKADSLSLPITCIINDNLPAITLSNEGSGDTFVGYNDGAGITARFRTTNFLNSSPTIYGQTNGSGPAIMGMAGTGLAGEFVGKVKMDRLQITNGAETGKILASDEFGNAIWRRVTPEFIDTTGASNGKGLVYNGFNNSVEWSYPTAGSLSLPMIGSIEDNQPALRLSNLGPGEAFAGYNEYSGTAGLFKNINPVNTNPAIIGETSGTGPAIKGIAGTGLAGEFVGKVKMDELQLSTGAAAGKVLTSDESGNASWQQGGLTLPFSAVRSSIEMDEVFKISNYGPAIVARLVMWNDTQEASALHVESHGLHGAAASFFVSNIDNTSDAIYASVAGAGSALTAHSASGTAGWFMNNSNIEPTVYATSMGAAPAIIGTAGTGLAAEFTGKTKTTDLQVTNGAATGKVLTSDESGNATWQNTASYAAGSGLTLSDNLFSISTDGASSGQIMTYNGSSVAWSNPVASDLVLPVNATANTSGSAFQVTNVGDGTAGQFTISNTANTSPAAFAETTGSGPAIKALAGTGLAGEFVGKVKMDELQLTTGAATGKVLASDASGNGVWQQVTPGSIDTTGASYGKALVYNGGVMWDYPTAGSLSLPMIGSIDNQNPCLRLSNIGSGEVFVGYNEALGTAGLFMNRSSSNSKPAIIGETYGSGPAIKGIAGNGLAGEFIGTVKMDGLQLTTGAAAGKVLTSDHSGNASWQNTASYAAGSGLALNGAQFSIATGGVTTDMLAAGAVTPAKISTSGASSNQALIYNGSSAAWGNPAASSLVLPFSINASSDTPPLTVTNNGTSSAVNFITTSDNNTNYTLGAYSFGKNGGAGMFSLLQRDNYYTALNATTVGTGEAGYFKINNSSNSNPAVHAETNGSGPAVKANAGTGLAGEFVGKTKTTDLQVTNGAAAGKVLTSDASGNATWQNAASYTAGAGLALSGNQFSIATGSITASMLATNSVDSTKLASNAVTPAKISTSGASSGQSLMYNGSSVVWGLPKASDLALPFTGTVSNSNPAMTLTNTGTGVGAKFVINNASNNSAAVFAETNGIANAIESKASGSGSAGYFHIDSSTNNKSGIYIWHGGSGPAIETHAANSGWAARFLGDGATSNGVYISAPSGRVGLQVASGTKNAVVATSDGARLMYTEESTEVWFTDYGFGKLQNGRVTVTIDLKFAETVTLTERYHVFVQAYDDAEIYVTNRTAASFEVVLRDGDKDCEFSYRIVAKRKGYETDRMKRSPSADNDPNLYPGK